MKTSNGLKIVLALFLVYNIGCSKDSDITDNPKTFGNEKDSVLTIKKDSTISVIIDSTSTIVNDSTVVIGTLASEVDYYQGTIVFKFQEPYTIGQFANGDYWVHNNGNPVVIASMTPESANVNSRIINGAMVNPENIPVQGYGSNPDPRGYMAFDPSLNKDPGISGQPLSVLPGSSVIKAISMPTTDPRPIISDAAILTVLASAPPENSFRPTYIGNDKSIIATTEDLNYSVLGKHARLGNEPDINTVSTYYERVWLDHSTFAARDIHPLNHMPEYAREMTTELSHGLLLLQLDYSDLEKEALLINMVQYGLDVYGIVKSGGIYKANGGQNFGRKMPLLLAGKVLNNPQILDYADKEKHFIFQDDQQYFYVSQADVDITHSSAWNPDARNGTPIPYEVSDIGMPEWGIRNSAEPERNNKHNDVKYRHINGVPIAKHILAARMMGVKDDWNWSPTFDYVDRYYQVNSDKFSGYFVSLWNAYR